MFTDQSCEVRLCKGDAQFTETIHTNGNPVSGLGISKEDSKDMPSYWEGGAELANSNCLIRQKDE
jgi:hypothetical protein